VTDTGAIGDPPMPDPQRCSSIATTAHETETRRAVDLYQLEWSEIVGKTKRILHRHRI